MQFISAVCRTHTNDLKSLLHYSVQQSALTYLSMAAYQARMKDYSRILIQPLLYEVFQRQHIYNLVLPSHLVRYSPFLLQQGRHHISDFIFNTFWIIQCNPKDCAVCREKISFSEICFECFHQFLVLDSVFSGSPHISDSDISEFFDYHSPHLLLRIVEA